jgi:hypothetical protein
MVLADFPTYKRKLSEVFIENAYPPKTNALPMRELKIGWQECTPKPHMNFILFWMK